MTLSDLSNAVGGRFLNYDLPASASFAQIAVELSLVREGSAAFILTEDEVTARRLIVLARKRGAAAVVSAVPPYFHNISCILVENIFEALIRAGE